MVDKSRTKEARAAYYRRHREAVLAKANQYYADNCAVVKKKRNERHRRKREADGKIYHKGRPGRPGPTSEQRTAQKIAQREYTKQWREKNPEKHKAQTKRHYANTKDYFLSNARAYRYRKKKAPGTHDAADIKWLRKMQHNKCAFCLLPFGSETPDIDHYIPIARGGSNDRKNLRLLHAKCNRKKHAKHPVDFGLSHGLLAW